MTNPVTILYDPNRGFRTWHISEIYFGPNQTTDGNVVPNIDDLIIDYNRGAFRVVDVANAPTYIPTLKIVDFHVLSTEQVGLGGSQRLGLYQPTVLELAFLNTAVIPHTLTIDDRYRCYGVEKVYFKVFAGTDLSPITGTVISQLFDGNGNFVSENIPLVTIDPNNPAIKAPPVFNTDVSLLDGDVVTLETYTLAGGPAGTHTFIIKNSNAIKGLGSSTITIVDIVLDTNMLDTITLDTINVPANIPITGTDFQARLLYSDGSSLQVSVGTNKCKLLGIDKFNTSLAGESSDVVLVYYPDTTEPAVNITNMVNRSVVHKYKLRTVNNVLDYSFKLYVVPTFNSNSQRFTNTYYLTNVSYTILIQIPDNNLIVSLSDGGTVDYSSNAGPQTLRVAIYMPDIIPHGYTGYTFIQLFTIDYGAISEIPWLIDYLNNNSFIYGAQAYFEYSTQGQQALSVKSGAVSVEEWIARLYGALHPIYDQSISLAPPTPTHFQLKYKGILSPVREIALYWNILLPNDFGGNYTDFDTITIIFLTPSTDTVTYSTLAVGGVILRNTLT